MAGAKLVWRATVLPKVKLFYWLGLHGRLWTGDRRKRHGLQDDDLCALCDQASETTDHLLLSCVYSTEVWFRILMRCGRNMLAPTDTDLLLSWWLQSREALPPRIRLANHAGYVGHLEGEMQEGLREEAVHAGKVN